MPYDIIAELSKHISSRDLVALSNVSLRLRGHVTDLIFQTTITSFRERVKLESLPDISEVTLDKREMVAKSRQQFVDHLRRAEESPTVKGKLRELYHATISFPNLDPLAQLWIVENCRDLKLPPYIEDVASEEKFKMRLHACSNKQLKRLLSGLGRESIQKFLLSWIDPACKRQSLESVFWGYSIAQGRYVEVDTSWLNPDDLGWMSQYERCRKRPDNPTPSESSLLGFSDLMRSTRDPEAVSASFISLEPLLLRSYDARKAFTVIVNSLGSPYEWQLPPCIERLRQNIQNSRLVRRYLYWDISHRHRFSFSGWKLIENWVADDGPGRGWIYLGNTSFEEAIAYVNSFEMKEEKIKISWHIVSSAAREGRILEFLDFAKSLPYVDRDAEYYFKTVYVILSSFQSGAMDAVYHFNWLRDFDSDVLIDREVIRLSSYDKTMKEPLLELAKLIHLHLAVTKILLADGKIEEAVDYILEYHDNGVKSNCALTFLVEHLERESLKKFVMLFRSKPLLDRLQLQEALLSKVRDDSQRDELIELLFFSTPQADIVSRADSLASSYFGWKLNTWVF